MHLRSLKMKIILSSTLCILIVGLFSNIFLYDYLTGIIVEKADNVALANLDSVKTRLDQDLERFYNLGYTCSNDLEIARVLRYSGLKTLSQKNAGIKAQEKLWGLLESSSVKKYITMLIVFNQDGVMAQPSNARYQGSQPDISRIQELPVFSEFSGNNRFWTLSASQSIVNGSDCFAFLSPVYDLAASTNRGWLYFEINPVWISEEAVSSLSEGFFLLENNKTIFLPDQIDGKFPDLLQTADGNEIHIEERTYTLRSVPLAIGDFQLVNYSDMTFLNQDRQPILFTTLVVIAASLSVAILLSVILSNLITHPLRRLTSRIGKIANNDFSYDPLIEKGNDEISQTGRMVNQMVKSIESLLNETEEMYVEQKNSEIALLQSQVNPHFLYNTLDSIHWMATIQKSDGIMTMTRSLSSLLRNLAKGVGDKITLGEELSLVNDYAKIQSIRYLEVFQLNDQIPLSFHKYQIVKFTLQPLIENAIFHGIEPKGEFGTIYLKVQETENELLIIVEDDGVGMPPEELAKLTANVQNTKYSTLSGLGVRNVDQRLKLIYGAEYGLIIESEKELFTRVIVRIPKEVS